MSRTALASRTSLDRIASLSEESRVRLHALGIHSVEALAARLNPAHVTNFTTPAWLAATHLSSEMLADVQREVKAEAQAFLHKAEQEPPMLAARGALPPPGTDAELPTVTRVEPLLVLARGSVGTGKNFVGRFGPVRNQGRRGTCVAHAMCALREFHSERSPEQDFSEQFAYWWCKSHDGIPDLSGTYVRTGCEGLTTAGVCMEPTWAYVPVPKQTEAQGPAPAGAESEALRFRLTSIKMAANAKDVDAILREVDKDRVVAIAVQTYPFWTDAEISRSGQISMPLGETPSGGHAVLIVGYDPAEEAFIFRNSWSELWAYESPYGAGYGSLPFEYVRQDAWEWCA